MSAQPYTLLQGFILDQAKLAAWACEDFDLRSEQMQTKLRKYLRLPACQASVQASTLSNAAQLLWITDLASNFYGAWLMDLLKQYATAQCDITCGHHDSDFATELVTHFTHNTSHALIAWHEQPQQSSAVMLNHIGLKPQVHDTQQAAIATSIFNVCEDGPADTAHERFLAFSGSYSQVTLSS